MAIVLELYPVLIFYLNTFGPDPNRQTHMKINQKPNQLSDDILFHDNSYSTTLSNSSSAYLHHMM